MRYTLEEVRTWLLGISDGALDLRARNTGLAKSAVYYLDAVVEPAPALPPGYLSPHFTLAEFVHSDTAKAQGIDNTPSAEVVARLEQLAALMEKVRAILGGNPVTITSGYRCPQLNAAVGGVDNSAHLTGDACDFIAPHYGTPSAVVDALRPHLMKLEVDQLIDENDGSVGSWVHIALAAEGCLPRYECFAA